ncbi:MAG: hypothetical protein Q7S28_02545 [bacterium]|nr:hypothetical protein [bacterium]
MLQFVQWGFWSGVAMTLGGIAICVLAKRAKTKEDFLDWRVSGIGIASFGMLPTIFYAAMWIAIVGSGPR